MNDENRILKRPKPTGYEVTYYDGYAVTHLDSQPCWFFRVMQRWLLGWRWTRLGEVKDTNND